MTISKTTGGRILCATLAAVALAAAGCSSSGTSSSSSGSSGSSGSSQSNSSGSSSTSQSPTQLVQAAYDKTSAAKTAKVAMSGNIAGTTLSGNGVISFVDHDSELTLNSPQGTIESRTVSGVTYTKLPAQALAALHTNKQWLKMDNSSASGKFGSSLPQPGDFSAYLQGISSSVTKVGTDSVRGTATTHYKAQVDLDKVAAAASAEQKKAIQTLEKANGTKTFPLEIWLDKDGLVRRVRTSVPIPKASSTTSSSSSSGTQNIVVTVEYYDFGTPVNVSAPPASQVTDLKSLLPGSD